VNAQGTSPDVDFVLLGCPHASVDQVRQTAAALDGRRLSPGTELWLMLPRALKDVAGGRPEPVRRLRRRERPVVRLVPGCTSRFPGR
jgi:predicted aconitase